MLVNVPNLLDAAEVKTVRGLMEAAPFVDGKETVLGPLDSCYIAAGETREIINRGNSVVTMLVAVEMPK